MASSDSSKIRSWRTCSIIDNHNTAHLRMMVRTGRTVIEIDKAANHRETLDMAIIYNKGEGNSSEQWEANRDSNRKTLPASSWQTLQRGRQGDKQKDKTRVWLVTTVTDVTSSKDTSYKIWWDDPTTKGLWRLSTWRWQGITIEQRGPYDKQKGTRGRMSRIREWNHGPGNSRLKL